MDEMDLLRKYADTQDQDAFAQLVRRHGDWVYSSARRQLGDEHLAEDVTQGVFLLLSRKASGQRGYAYLSGWLFNAVRFCAKEAKRQRIRRERREREAAEMRSQQPADADWIEIAPMLDEAVAQLSMRDRDAVLLRFYQGMSLAEVGKATGVNEEAAKKRVQRAVEKLRGMLAKKGVTAGGMMLGGMMVDNVMTAAPAGVVSSAMGLAGGGVEGTVAEAIATGAQKMMAWAKIKVAATLALVAIGTIYGASMAVEFHKPSAGAPTLAVPVTATPNPEAVSIPGTLPQYANWEFILDERAAKALLAACKAESAVGSGYATYRGPLARVHAVLKQAADSRQILNARNDGDTRFELQGDHPAIPARGFGGYASDGARISILRSGDYFIPITRMENGFRIALKDLRVEGKRWPTDGTERKWGATLALDAEVRPGEVVLAAKEVDFGAGVRVMHVLGWECFYATGTQYGRIMSSGWQGATWFGRLPEDLRKVADAALAYDATMAGPVTDRVAKLEGGAVMRLVAVGNPREYPLVTWNPDGGRPEQSYLGWLESEQGLVGVVEFFDTTRMPADLPKNDRDMRDPNVKNQGLIDRWYSRRVVEADAATGDIRIGIGAGPWLEIEPIHVGGKVVYEGVAVHMPQEPQGLPKGCTVLVTSQSREWEFGLIAINIQGETVEGICDEWPSKTVGGSDDGGGDSSTHFSIPAGQIGGYMLRARRVEWATFHGFAKQPSVSVK